MNPEDVKQSAIGYILDARNRLKRMVSLADSREATKKKEGKNLF